MIWHCVPLYDEGANFPLWQSPEREPRFCFPLQNGNGWALKCLNNRRGGWALKCLNNRRSLLSISWPMIPDPINPKRIRTNNCRLANRQLSSRDGTYIYIYQCHATLTISINLNHIQYLNFNINNMRSYLSLQYLNFNYATSFLNLAINIPNRILSNPLIP